MAGRQIEQSMGFHAPRPILDGNNPFANNQ